MSTPIETEVKIRFPENAASARARIEALGYTVRIPRTLEADQLFDLPGETLRASDRILRLRLESTSAGERWTLTYKGPASRERYKSREEIESGIGDGANLTLILSRLGYVPTFRYEKYRTTFGTTHQPGIVTVDETPLGLFLELEGPKEWIDQTAAHLGFSPADYVVSSYAALWTEYRGGHSHVSPNMTFPSQEQAPEGKHP